MYTYNIGYHSCEDSSYKQWYHELQYSHERLLEIVIGGLEIALVDWEARQAKNLEEFRRLPGWNARDEERHKDDRPSLSELISSNESFDKYLTSMGFAPLMMEQDISLFGWACAVQPKSWNEYTEEGDDTRAVQTKLAEKYNGPKKSL